MHDKSNASLVLPTKPIVEMSPTPTQVADTILVVQNIEQHVVVGKVTETTTLWKSATSFHFAL